MSYSPPTPEAKPIISIEFWLSQPVKIAFRARPDYTRQMLPRICISVCWAIYLLYWFISAIGIKRVAERQPWKNEAHYRFLTMVGVVFLIVQRWPHPLSAQIWDQTLPIVWTGIAVCYLGLIIAIWARWTLGGNWSANVTFKKDHELIERGPYHYVRHPIYTALILMCMGTAICKNTLAGWLGTVTLTISFWIKLQLEEAVMRTHFPSEYPSYEKRVKRLIPFVL
jgi:protein-S-isoprenylcysteine O-methyltransferase Ste14